MDFAALSTVFIAGLAGGVTCLAVQGGFLATAIARQTPVIVSRQAKRKHARQKTPTTTQTSIRLPNNPVPVLSFLSAKLIAYTLLGLILGAAGSALLSTPEIQTVTLGLAALFMIATALNMLNVHPIFRYTVIQPPRFISRLIRDQARSEEMFAPALLGLLTVFIPCGTTLAMETEAARSGFPLLGAVVMFVFTLGTIPIFLLLGYAPTLLKKRARTAFALASAFLVLGIGLYTLDNTLKLANSPFVPSRALASVFQPPDLATAARPQLVNGVQEVTINVYPTAYLPNFITADSGVPVRLLMVTNNTNGCTRAFTIPGLRVSQILPVTGVVPIDLPSQPPGSLYFTCGMGMYSGVIIFQ